VTPVVARRVTNDTDRIAGPGPHSGSVSRETGGMRIALYVVSALLALGLAVTSIGWYLSAHPGGVRFESCHWDGAKLVLGYTYGSGDTVSTMVHPAGDHVVAQLRVHEGSGSQTQEVLSGEATYPISGGPLTVKYPNGAELNCPARG
jgi:hypothetical protein